MGAIKDVYDVIKDLLSMAQKLNNIEMGSLVMDIQQTFFDLKEENQDLKENNKSLNKELEELNNEKDVLLEKLTDYESLKEKYNILTKQDFVFPEEMYELNFTEICYVMTSNTHLDKQIRIYNLESIFKSISKFMTTRIDSQNFIKSFNSLLPGYYVCNNQILEIKARLLALGLIETTEDSKKGELIGLTSLGKSIFNRMYK